MSMIDARQIFRHVSPPSSPVPAIALHHDFSKHVHLRRRHLLTALTLSFNFIAFAPFTTSLPIAEPVAAARGLFQMPPFRLSNRYFLVRAGESQFESMGVINTNPVAKTSVDSGLSERGKKQAVRAAFDLKEMGACDKSCWIWPAITQRAYQTSEIIASVNGVSRRFSD